MGEILPRIVASAVCSCVFFFATLKMLGVLQQGGYYNRALFKWLKKKDNLYAETLSLWSGLTLLACSLVIACFFFLGAKITGLLSAIPFLFFALLYARADSKRALKVPLKRTERVKRLSVCYLVVLLLSSYLLIALFTFIKSVVANSVYNYLCYLPFCFFPLLTPVLLALANAIDGVYERRVNAKFVAKAKEKLESSSVLKIAVVGSYGKTSVKNVLKEMLAQKYSVVATPESYNTPLGIAKTVLSADFDGKEVFIAEMGARHAGDIFELCELVKPDFAVFTGVCAQHVETFGSEENVFAEKAEIIKSTAKKIVCGAALKERVLAYGGLTAEEKEKCRFADLAETVSSVCYEAESTKFVLAIGGEKVGIETALLAEPAVENIALAALVAEEMGLSPIEISEAAKRLQPIPHRLQLIKENGVFILDDAYNANERGAQVAIKALERFPSRKILITPGLVETGVLNAELNGNFGKALAEANLTFVVLVGETLVKAVKDGFLAAGGQEEKLKQFPTLAKAQEWLGGEVQAEDAVLFLNDLPDLY
ncbi:MAG: UDP-N-acetylmuramoyl-tripeptide--D-alanyl-D-alanine ligase [Clostridia bacterium]|nr:UDP-N-acetylmuramoyl-tripeptide--D-alanyl-D-alanine ligase [Clostridia bacterium]